jgi:hypothetical protein
MMENGQLEAVLVYPIGYWYCHFYVSQKVDPAIADRIKAFIRHCLARFNEPRRR